ncbi:RUN and SH3 domain-containing protein 1 [Chionoecetes opilio]|uniref:RUN and SH3 domain-containing protein 1 n=1 Tax=Chionoecetes opilio TaxID=41210 RepID=A0A8J4YLV8_CHIOP|nr:RUN and SH3 domain-containing protein 1 [Chionoecetes opilio]
MREDLLKRRSLQEPMEHMAQRVARETIPEATPSSIPHEAEEEAIPTIPSPMGCSCVSQCTGFCSKGLHKKNLLRVSELPDVSSHEDLTEDDLLRIRSQVSNLLVARGSVGSLMAEGGASCELCPKKSVSFAEKNPSEGGGGSPFGAEVPGAAAEEETRPMVYDAHDKKTLVLSVRAAVEKLVTHFSTGGTQQEKVRLGTSAMTPAVAQLALDKLCPAVYALLSDGLHPSLQSLFGKINNSVWRFIEVTSQISKCDQFVTSL